MSGLGPEARALLDAARDGLSPSPTAIHRVRAKVGASAAAGTAGATLAVKLGLVVVIAASAVGAGVYASKRGPDSEVPRIELAPAVVEAPTQLAVHEPAAPPPGEIDLAPMVVARAHPSAVVVADLPPATVDLAREVELVDAAMTALKRGDANAALAAVARHALETHGAGQLAEDAAAIEVEALCRLHDPTTNTKLEAFDARFPKSAQRSRLSNRCP